MNNNYYVYVYIDPRNNEEFYYGKGKGSRKKAHLKIDPTSEIVQEKAKRIREIQKEGLKPVIRVIASKLTNNEALLVETTLIWKLGKYTTNIAPGNLSRKFRPHDTLHKEVSDFDFQNGIYYYNVGEGLHRNWDDYLEFGFISAGQGEKWRDAILKFQKGDVVVAYLKKHGFVGVGRVVEPAQRIKDVTVKETLFLNLPLKCKGMGDNSGNPQKSEYVALVNWVKSVPRERAKWKAKCGLYTTPLIRASLDGQEKTMDVEQTQSNAKNYSMM